MLSLTSPLILNMEKVISKISGLGLFTVDLYFDVIDEMSILPNEQTNTKQTELEQIVV